MSNNRFYIENSSMFNNGRYNTRVLRRVLSKYIKNPRESYKDGLNNQPKVLTFEFNYHWFNNDNDAINFCANLLAMKLFDGKTPFIFLKDW